MFVDGVHTVVITEQLKCVKMVLFQNKIQGELLLDCTLKKESSHLFRLSPTSYQSPNFPAASELHMIFSEEVIWFYHLSLPNIPLIHSLALSRELLNDYDSSCAVIKNTTRTFLLGFSKSHSRDSILYWFSRTTSFFEGPQNLYNLEILKHIYFMHSYTQVSQHRCIGQRQLA